MFAVYFRMLRTFGFLALLQILFFARESYQSTHKVNTSMLPKMSILSIMDESTVKSYPCPKECSCRLLTNPERMDVSCTVDVLNKSRYFSDLNKTNILSYMGVNCNSDKPGRLPDGIFQSLHTFAGLTILDCKLVHVSARAFSGMTSLSRLVIRGGKITNFDKGSLQIPELSKLEVVSFTETSLSYAPSLCNLTNLWLVNISKNGIKRFEDTGLICQKPGNIEIIDISENYIRYLPTKFKSVSSKLKCLVCSNNNINKINETVFETLTDMEILDVRHNRLTDFPFDFLNDSSKMQTLRLGYNKIEVLSKGIFSSLKNMSLLNMDAMGLKNNVWSELKCLTTLRQLYIRCNNIDSFDTETMYALKKLERMELSGNLFKQILNRTFAFQGKVMSLNMSSNLVEEIDKDAFIGLSSLKLLDLKHNQIKKIHSDALSQLRLLEILNLSYNHIEILPRFPLSLKGIDLRCNDVVTFHPFTFYGITSLIGINLMSNRLTVLPNNAFTNTNLQLLNLANNNISSVGDQIPWPTQLQNLILRNNSISNIDFVTNMYCLKVLDLSYNKLTTLAAGKEKWLFPNSMEELILGWNNIHFVQNFVFQLSNIRDIDLRMNRISTLSREALHVSQTNLMPVNYYLLGNPFSCDCNLAWIEDVSSVQNGVYFESYIIRDIGSLYCENVYRHKPGLMKDLPTTKFLCTYAETCPPNCECCSTLICPCRRYCPKNCTCYQNNKQDVNIVDCIGAKLQSVPQNISTTCTILDISGNTFTTIASGTFKTLSHLKELYLNRSHIYEIKSKTFTGLYNISILDLGYNFLHSIVPAMFHGLGNLEVLTLSFNNINFIQERSFDPLTKLWYLDISGNDLKTLSRHEFASMSKLTSLKLSENPWSCECQYLEIMNNFTWGNARHIVDLNKVVCEIRNVSSIHETKVHPLLDLHIPDFCRNSNQSNTKSDSLGKPAIAVLSTVLLVFAFGLVIFGIGFRNREIIKVWCFVKFGWKLYHTENDKETNRSYDAFVSYSSHDEIFIVRELVPYLEQSKQSREGFKLCVHYRDFPVGAPIAETIILAVKRSKRVIIVLSNNFLKSEWCQYEFQAAHHQLLQEKKNRIIMILLHDINNDLLDEELNLYLKTCTYVRYGDRWFWPKIEYAMPKLKQMHVQDSGTYIIDDEVESMIESQQEQAKRRDSQCGDDIELIA